MIKKTLAVLTVGALLGLIALNAPAVGKPTSNLSLGDIKTDRVQTSGKPQDPSCAWFVEAVR